MSSSVNVRTRWHALVALAVVALVVMAAAHGALFAAFDPHRDGQQPLMALRGVLLVAIFIASRGQPKAAPILFTTMALFVASLAVRGGVVAFTVAGGVALAILPAVPLERAGPKTATALKPKTVIFGALALALGAVMAFLVRPPVLPPLPSPQTPPRQSTRLWLEADNPWRARASALTWAKLEGADPGEAYLELARIDRLLGYEAKARKVLEKVRDKSTSDVHRRRAAELLGEDPR